MKDHIHSQLPKGITVTKQEPRRHDKTPISSIFCDITVNPGQSMRTHASEQVEKAWEYEK